MSMDIFSLLTLAQASQLPTYGPDWQTIAMALLSVVVAMIANYAKTIAARVTKLEAEHASLHVLIKGDYPTRQEFNQSFQRVEDALRGITTRLDNLNDHNRG